MPEPVNILYLCAGNSCRSQMAEGWTRRLGGNRVEVHSAGIEVFGKNPRAIAVMSEAGINISDQESTVVSNFFELAVAAAISIFGLQSGAIFSRLQCRFPWCRTSMATAWKTTMWLGRGFDGIFMLYHEA